MPAEEEQSDARVHQEGAAARDLYLAARDIIINNHLEIREQPGSLAGLQAEVNRPVLALLINFENYMEHIGGMEEQPALLPGGIWPVIDVAAYGLSATFIKEHDLAPAEPVGPGGFELGEALAFLLKVAWERGYFMYKFYRFDCMPLATAPVDPRRIMDAIVAEASPARPNLASDIEVILQRAVSLCTEPRPVRESLRMIDASLARRLESHLADWADVVRSAHGWGILSAKAEDTLRGGS